MGVLLAHNISGGVTDLLISDVNTCSSRGLFPDWRYLTFTLRKSSSHPCRNSQRSEQYNFSGGIIVTKSFSIIKQKPIYALLIWRGLTDGLGIFNIVPEIFGNCVSNIIRIA